MVGNNHQSKSADGTVSAAQNPKASVGLTENRNGEYHHEGQNADPNDGHVKDRIERPIDDSLENSVEEMALSNPQTPDPFVPNWAEIDPIALLEPPRVQPDGSVVLTTSAGDLALYLFQSGFRIRCANANLDRYDIVQSEPPMHDMTIETSDEHVTVHGGDLQLTLARNPLSFEFSYRGQVKLRSARDAHFARRHRLPPLARHQGTWLWSLDLDPEEPIYGLGEKWSALNKRGQWLRSFNEDALGVNAEASYKNTPFLWSPRGWGCFCHTPAAVIHSVGFAPWSQRAYVGRLEDAVLDLWFFGGDTPQDILTQYTALTGRAKQPPVWSLGAILSKAYYRTADELLDTLLSIVCARASREGLP